MNNRHNNRPTSQTTAVRRPRNDAEDRFEANAGGLPPFRATQETEFEKLRNRLITESLVTASQPGLNAPIRRAANEAAALAWVTFLPLLFFPALFEEKAGQATRHAARQARIYAHTTDLVAA